MRTMITGLAFVLLLTLPLSGCTSKETGAGAPASGANTLICEVFYRPSAGQSLQAAPLITFAEGGDQRIHQFENMALEAKYQDDQFEGRALSLAVINLETGDEISRQLYQFDPQSPPVNQFIGGHGFTGLNYVFHPGSSAEIQYFCTVKQD